MMPVYNAGRYLAATLDSVLAQTVVDFEVIAIDDGSTDRSPRILREYERKDPRLRVRCRENRGAVTTRNEILELTRGEFIAVNDADDLSLPDRFFHQVKFLRDHPQVVCVGGQVEYIDARSRGLTTIAMPLADDDIQRLLVRGVCTIQHSAAMIRRSALRHVGGYNPRFNLANDLDLFLRLGEVGLLANLDRAVARYRLHPASAGARYQLEQRSLCKLACEEACKRRGVSAAFEAGRPTRPTGDRRSLHSFMLLWGWWAFNRGDRITALQYGARSVALLPLDTRGWRLAACALTKRRRRPEKHVNAAPHPQ